MKLIIANDHFIADIDGQKFIVDTGSPISFNYIGVSSLEINGEQYRFSNQIVCPKEDAEKLVGINVDGFIGTDILKKTGLNIDMENNILEFSCNSDNADGVFATLSLNYFMGSYLITSDICLGRQLDRVIIDTGAPVPYVSATLKRTFETTGEYYKDSSPIYGELSGEYSKADLVFFVDGKEYHRPVKVGLMPGILDAFGMFDAIIGITALSDKQVVFDFENMRIRIKL